MNNIFSIYLANDRVSDGRSTTLILPAAPYELLDALDILQLQKGDRMYFQVEEYYGFEYLAPFLDEQCSLYELNALAHRLSELDARQGIAFEGLVKMEVAKREGPLYISKLIDLAYSADCCHVVGEARNDSQLGRFYAENGFIPELDDLPENIFNMLDFERIGREMRLGEHGVFTEHAYVVQDEDLRQIYDSLDMALHKPSYIFRLTLDRYPFEGEERHQSLDVPLELPAAPDQMDAVLGKLELPTWESAVITSFDGAVSDLDLDLFFMGSLDPLNELAHKVRQLDADDRLVLYKAVLHAADCHDVDEAIRFANDIDAYIIDPEQRTAGELAMDELRFTMGEEASQLLQKHVDLHAYGTELLAASNAAMTPYGLVQRRDGKPMQVIDDPTPEMTMQ